MFFKKVVYFKYIILLLSLRLQEVIEKRQKNGTHDLKNGLGEYSQ